MIGGERRRQRPMRTLSGVMYAGTREEASEDTSTPRAALGFDRLESDSVEEDVHSRKDECS